MASLGETLNNTKPLTKVTNVFVCTNDTIKEQKLFKYITLNFPLLS